MSVEFVVFSITERQNILPGNTRIKDEKIYLMLTIEG